jgi:AcrR family transcriptional regulator
VGRIAGVSADETRGRLLDAAARVFELKGYEGATVALIAKEAGVTTGAIYAHYGGKAELMVDAIRAHGERATAGLFAVDGPNGAAGMLTRLGDRLLARDGSDAGLLLEALHAARRDPALAEVVAGALAERSALVTQLLDGAQRSAELTSDVSAVAAARFMLMLGLGSMLMSELDLPAVEASEWNTFITRLVAGFADGTGMEKGEPE